ncbi:hypothetical protein [Rouxiella sp. Mn2063]|uniref:hypothetical protein n=1 Tax=Rouxiella sp. Mn2063 TaxID=3395262 RepID=UPI003BC1D525
MRVFYRHHGDKNRLNTKSFPGLLAANPALTRWLDKPRWQRVMWMGAVLLILCCGAYWLMIHGLWQEQQRISQDVSQQRLTVITQYRALLLRPVRAEVDEKRQALLMQEKSRPPLTQQIAAPLAASNARLKQWQPEPAVESGLSRSALKVQMDYPGLAVFLQKLLAGSSPPSIEQLSLNAISGELDIDMLLSASRYSAQRPAMPDVVLSRDPFNQRTIEQCLERHDVLSQSLLKGIVGSNTKRTGWLAWPDGSWKKAQAGHSISSTDWLVDSVATDSIVLIRHGLKNDGASCDAGHKRMSLHPESENQKKPEKALQKWINKAEQDDMDDQGS